MLNTLLRPWLVGGWCATLVVIMGIAMAMGASPSTSAFLLVLGVTPAVILMIVRRGASSPTVAEVLHSVEMQDRRG